MQEFLWWQQLTLMWKAAILYAIVINIVAFVVYGWDKMRSRTHLRRVPEKTLWLLALFGGSIGAIFGMNFFRHKTKKLSFQVGIALILALQIVVAVLVLT